MGGEPRAPRADRDGPIAPARIRSPRRTSIPSTGGPALRWHLPAVGAAAVLVYANAFGNAFVWDDLHLIVDNPAIKRLSGLWTLWSADLFPRGRTDDARRAFEAALRFDPRYGAAHSNLGNDHFRRGQLAEAAEAYRTAIALDPRLDEVRRNLDVVLRARSPGAGAPAPTR